MAWLPEVHRKIEGPGWRRLRFAPLLEPQWLLRSFQWPREWPLFPRLGTRLPDGLLALLVTDLVGFTPMVERLGDARARSLMRWHNLSVRRCLRAWSGCEVDHTGDGVIAAFRSVAAALGCAADVQRAMAAHSLRHPAALLHVRMGVHAGEPVPEDGRLFGQCVNVAVRVCATAAPGTVLVTPVVKQLAAGRIVFGVGRRCTLKGVCGALSLYEFAWDGSHTHVLAKARSLRALPDP